jgi:hypothetical protein
MVALTYGANNSAADSANAANVNKGLYSVLFEAAADTQKKPAECEVVSRRELLARNEDEPFGGW